MNFEISGFCFDIWEGIMFSTFSEGKYFGKETHPKRDICARICILFEGFLEIAGTGIAGLIAQFSKYDFRNLWEIWHRNI